MITVIDNYDSFTFNLVQYLWELKAEVVVLRNDEKTVDEIIASKPDHILVSPGPCTPDDAGVSVELIRAAADQRIPSSESASAINPLAKRLAAMSFVLRV